MKQQKRNCNFFAYTFLFILKAQIWNSICFSHTLYLPRKKRNDENQDEDEDEVHAIDGEEVDTFANNRATISHSCMQRYKSAIVWYYAEKGQTLDPLLNSWCDNFINGYKKTVAD